MDGGIALVTCSLGLHVDLAACGAVEPNRDMIIGYDLQKNYRIFPLPYQHPIKLSSDIILTVLGQR